MSTKQQIGSYTAKGGFANEHDILRKFENWKTDKEAAAWLRLMGYSTDLIDDIDVIHIPSRLSRKSLLELGANDENIAVTKTHKKADIQLRIQLRHDNVVYVENLSLKRSKKHAGFNHVGKRSVETYARFWNMPDDIIYWLKCFTGAIKPEDIEGVDLENLKDKKHRRIYFTEMPETMRAKIIRFFEDNKQQVISDLLRGRGVLSADWLLVTEVDGATGKHRWVLSDIHHAINYFSERSVRVSPRGSLHVGRVFMQRKGGTPDPTSLQFKIHPLALFNAR